MSFLSRLKSVLRIGSAARQDKPGDEDAGLPVPAHVAIIMDGNNRWARRRGLPPAAGHRAGVEVIRKILEECRDRGIAALTLYAFSSENWLRPAQEVRDLMNLLRSYLEGEIDSLHQQGMRVRFIGRRDRLDAGIVALMEAAEQKTAGNTAGTLVLAVDYGGRWDIVQASQALAAQVRDGELAIDAIDETLLGERMGLAGLPEPDLCIRTGAEHRLSNFLLWQLSYAELYFTDCYWPDFGRAEFGRALDDFGRRQRRYGSRPGLASRKSDAVGVSGGIAGNDAGSVAGIDEAGIDAAQRQADSAGNQRTQASPALGDGHNA